MVRYRVIRDTFGFKGGYWTEGQIVDLQDDEVPPKHFERLDGREVPSKAPEPSEPSTFSEMTERAGRDDMPATGFAASLKKTGRKK